MDFLVTEGLGDHETIEPKQVELTSTAFYYYNTHLLAKMANLLGKKDDAEKYEQLAGRIKSAFLSKFYDPQTGQLGIHTEANQSFAIYMRLLGPKQEEKALAVLKDQVLNVNKGHVGTGIFGTKYMMEVLSENNMTSLACGMAGQLDCPGWGYMFGQGATTLWEHWAFSDNTFSHNHPMFGSVSGWFFKYLAGIRPDPEAAAYNKVIFQPAGCAKLGFAKAVYRSPCGTIRASWTISGGVFNYDLDIPVNTDARVWLPASSAAKVREGGRTLDQQGIPVVEKSKGWIACHAGSGKYHFTIGHFREPDSQ